MFKQGYLVEVTTWENDADHFKTKQLSGQSKPQVTFLLALLGHFYSGTNHPTDYPLFGNDGLCGEMEKGVRDRTYQQFIESMDVLRETYVEEFDSFFKHEDDKDKTWEEIKASLYVDTTIEKALCQYYYDPLTNILGYTEEYLDEDCFFRVVHNITVYYIPEDINSLPLEAFSA